MDTQSLHYRNMAFLLSLGVLPACPDKDPVDPTEGDTTNGPGGTATDPTTGPGDPTTTGTTTTDETTTTGTTGPDETGPDMTTGPVVTAGEETVGEATFGESTFGEETTGEPVPVPEFCMMYAMKQAECYPRYAGRVDQLAQECAQYFMVISREVPECAPLLEEYGACLSALSCEEFKTPNACPAESAAFEKCDGG